MKPLQRVTLLGFVLWLGFAVPARSQAVRAWQGTIDIPTYAVGEEDPNPPFPLANRHRIYPYTMLDDLTDRLETKSYKAVFLENQYLRAIVLPGMGGRLYSLYDKLNKHEVFYRNNVVKYGLVALRGAWISGGIEFNFPDGHTVITVSPVASVLRQDPDGSATVVVGDVDQVTGMHWEVALTLRPGQARLEQQVTLFNATPLTNLYWFWANAAVPATDDMQFIYPMREAYPHSRDVVWTYPIYKGVDYSWYKNVRAPTSLFGRQVHREFFGAYYHQTDYGVIHVADYHEVPGKKIWTWGVADDGLIWTNLLTDHDGPYNEIQAGRYETQLNYELMAPRRVESFTEYWYPVRGLNGGFVEATSQLALNVGIFPPSGGEKQHAEVVLFPTVGIKEAKVRVMLGSQLLREFGPLSFEPMTAVHLGVPVEDLAAAKSKIAVEVESSAKRILLRWGAADPVDGNPDFIPAAGAPQPTPPEKMAVEELFQRGVEQEKAGREEAARETYEAVLARDPGYIPALLQQAWRAYRAADLARAGERLGHAMARDAFDPRLHYAAGVVYRASERWALAQDAFWTAMHYGSPPAPALAQLGEISIRIKNYDEAVKLLRRALSYNPDDAAAQTDLAVALRLAGRFDEAERAVDEALRKMPLLPWALAERWRIGEARGASTSSREGAAAEWNASLPADVQDYLELAAWYHSLDDSASADAVLTTAVRDLPSQALSPLVYYYLASDARRQGQDQRAQEYAAKAAAAPYAKVFPNRLEDAAVLDEALLRNPLDAHAQYFLGNFLFAHGRYEDAARFWAQAFGKGFEYSVLLRNLGLCAWRVKKDLTGAAGFYESAIRLAPNDYRLYLDLDEIYLQSGDQAHRQKLFAQAPPAVLERDTVQARRALLLAQRQQYDQALELLTNRHFKPWEGGVVVRQMFVLANVLKGRQALEAKNFAEAETAFRRALEYPASLGTGKPDKPQDAEQLFWLGEALAAQGKTEAARNAWRQAAEEGKTGSRAASLYCGLALRRLGQAEEADKVLKPLAQAASEPKPSADDFYLAGLLDLFENRAEQGKSRLGRALELDPSLWQARIELDRAGT